MVTKVKKWGNSQGVRFTKAMLADAEIGVGDAVAVTVQKGRIVVEPAVKVRGKYRLKALLAKMPKDYRPQETEWGAPAGKEVW